MKLLLVFAFLALICMGRSAPTPSSTPRVLILPDYHDETHEELKPHEDEINVIDDDEIEDDDDDEDTTTTTTTTTTRRSTFVFPTRNRNLIPSRRPGQTQRTSSIRTTTMPFEDEKEENINEYDGDFKYIRNFRKYVQQLMEDIKKIVRNLTGYDFSHTIQRQQNNQNEEEY